MTYSHLSRTHRSRRAAPVGAVALPAALAAGTSSSFDDIARWAVIGIAVAVTVLLIAWFMSTRRHPESAADHASSESVTARKPDGVARRPAGPAAENMDADPPGGRTPPGPWPGSSPVPPDASGAPD